MATGGIDRERLRQLAAIAAMEGNIACDVRDVRSAQDIAELAVECADELLAKLGETAPAEGTERKEAIPDVRDKLNILSGDTTAYLNNRFGYHKPDAETSRLLTEIRQRTLEHAIWLTQVCPNGREQALALTSLEEASMWAVKALVLKCPLGDAHA